MVVRASRPDAARRGAGSGSEYAPRQATSERITRSPVRRRLGRCARRRGVRSRRGRALPEPSADNARTSSRPSGSGAQRPGAPNRAAQFAPPAILVDGKSLLTSESRCGVQTGFESRRSRSEKALQTRRLCGGDVFCETVGTPRGRTEDVP
jgi:hypothetical protein